MAGPGVALAAWRGHSTAGSIISVGTLFEKSKIRARARVRSFREPRCRVDRCGTRLFPALSSVPAKLILIGDAEASKAGRRIGRLGCSRLRKAAGSSPAPCRSRHQTRRTSSSWEERRREPTSRRCSRCVRRVARLLLLRPCSKLSAGSSGALLLDDPKWRALTRSRGVPRRSADIR